jgi:ATPase subunit of ABC transporter with duplicated ATPase domains
MQGVSHNHKSEIGKHFSTLIKDVETELVNASSVVEEFDKKKTIHRGYVAAVDALVREIEGLSLQVSHIETDVAKREKIVDSILGNNADVEGEKAKLKTIAANACSYVSRKTELLEERKIQELSLMLLKDSGIKAAIIKEYVPILNKLINKYLGMFGFFINFTLDENFNETIVSRGRDEFSYSSFSEGEKRRIDLAILFAFRQISEMKNSASCNILVLDEVGSENFDLNARDMLMDLISELGGNNFIVSHSQSLDATRFDSVMKVTKKSEFSTLEFI